MRIVRHCERDRFPGGVRLWQKVARAGGFKGTLHLTGFGHSKYHYGKYIKDKAGITLGYTDGKDVHVFVNTAGCRKLTLVGAEVPPIFVFAHEIGHTHQVKTGQKMLNTVLMNVKEAMETEQEKWADRYARRLLKRVGVNARSGRPT